MDSFPILLDGSFPLGAFLSKRRAQPWTAKGGYQKIFPPAPVAPNPIVIDPRESTTDVKRGRKGPNVVGKKGGKHSGAGFLYRPLVLFRDIRLFDYSRITLDFSGVNVSGCHLRCGKWPPK